MAYASTGSGSGGAGGAGATPDGTPGLEASDDSARDSGGGGGGAGRIRVNSGPGSAVNGLMSPDPTTGLFTLGALKTAP